MHDGISNNTVLDKLREILKAMMVCDGQLSSRELQDRFQISRRTFNDIVDTLVQLGRKFNCRIQRKRGVGLVFDRLDTNKAELIWREFFRHCLTKTTTLGRQYFIVHSLLICHDCVSSDYLCDRLYISRSTLRRDLDVLRNWFSTNGVRLCKMGRKYVLEGPEQCIREAFTSLLLSEVENLDGTIDWPSLETVFEMLNIRVDPSLCFSLIKSYVSALSDRVPGSELTSILVYLLVAACRRRVGRLLELAPTAIQWVQNRREYYVAKRIVTSLGSLLAVNCDPAEIAWVSFRLLLIMERSVSDEQGANVDPEALELAVDFVKSAQCMLLVDLQKDERLVMSIASHVGSTLLRLRLGLPLRNPLSDIIEKRYPMLVRVARKAASVLSGRLMGCLPPNEVTCLATYLGAALERTVATAKRRNVVVAYQANPSQGQLLAAILSRSIPEVNVIEVSSYADLDKVLDSLEVQLVITGTPMGRCKAPVYVVEGIPGMVDIEFLRKIIADSVGVNNNAYRPWEVARVCTGKDTSVDNEYYYLFQDVLNKENVALGREVSDWESAVRLAGFLMVQTGFVQDSYVEAMVRTVKEFGPYILVAPGVAMPHARPEHGVRKVGASLLTLSRPVAFPGSKNNLADLIIACASDGTDRHIKMIAQVAIMIENKNIVDRLRAAKNVEEAIAVFHMIVPE